MFELFQLQAEIGAIVVLVILVVEGFAFIDAVARPAQAYVAADKLNKQAWLLILGLAIPANIWIGGLLSLVGVVAALVYLLDARPALQSVTRR